MTFALTWKMSYPRRDWPARHDHERVGTVNIMGLLNQSDSTTLEQGMQQEMSKETRQAERRDL